MDLAGKLGDPARVDASLSDLARGVIGSEILRIAAEIRALKAKGADDLQPHRRRLRSGAVSRRRPRCSTACARRWPPGRPTTRPRTACSGCARRWRASTRKQPGAVVPGRVGADHRRRAAAALRVVPHGARSRRRGGLPGAVVEQQPLRLPVRRARRSRSRCAPTRTSSRRPTSCARTSAYARLVLINSPLNPTGTVIDPEVLRQICEMVVEENRRREPAPAARPLWLCYDQVYWQLVFGARRPGTPRRPRSARTSRPTPSSSTRRRRASRRPGCASAGR